MEDERQNARREWSNSDRFVGRREEIAVLTHLVEETLAGRAQKAAVVGPSGAGKSRLIREVARYATWRGLAVVDTANRLVVRGSRLILLDPFTPDTPSSLPHAERLLPVVADFLLVTGRSAAVLAPLALPPPSILRLRGFDEAEAIEFLRPLARAAFEWEWARAVARRTNGLPGLLIEEARRHVSGHTGSSPQPPR